MITSPNLTITELEQLWLELFLNKTDKVSDVSDDSVLSGTAFGCAKVAQKALKDIAITEAKLFPKYAKGNYLDESAQLFGAEERRGEIGSSTFLLVKALPGTVYEKSVNVFKNINSITFEMEEDTVTIGDLGLDYIKVRSVGTGSITKVLPNTINTVTPVPSGHIAVINEYICDGGCDEESDEVFRNRILSSKSYLSRSTISFFSQILQSIDDRILCVYNLGRDDDGVSILAISTQNGVEFSDIELDYMLEQLKPYLSISEISTFGDVVGLKLVNIEYHYIGGVSGIDFRCQLDPQYNSDEIRKDIQIQIQKKFDFRTWVMGSKIEWDDLLEIVKNVEGVRYVYDDYFSPNLDETVPFGKLPRVKTFVMRDLNGNIIYDSNGLLLPIFYLSNT